MISQGTVIFRGASGERYRFLVWPIGTKFRASGAVCLFSKRTFPNRTFAQTASHQCVCVGHTPDLSRLAYHLPQLASADCVCIYLAADAQQRLRVQDDLVEGLGVSGANLLVDLSPSHAASSAGPDDAVTDLAPADHEGGA